MDTPTQDRNLHAPEAEAVAEVDRRQPPPSEPANEGSKAAQSRGSKPADEGSNKRVARVYSPSFKAQVLEYVAAHGVSAAATKFGVSRFLVHEWRRLARLAANGQGPAPTSGEAPEELEAQRDREILSEWKRQPGLGPSQIRNQLRRKGVKVGVHTVQRVMIENGYRPPKVKRVGHDERFEAVRPNQLWHLDFVHR